MKVVVQRCFEASVSVDNIVKGKIEKGLVILVGFTSENDKDILDYMVNKIVNLRIFDDEYGVMNKSLNDIKGSILLVSQFTLYADTLKGNRPSYIKALNGKEAKILYDEFYKKLSINNTVETGVFGADMKVSLINDGPVTIILEKEKKDER